MVVIVVLEFEAKLIGGYLRGYGFSLHLESACPASFNIMLSNGRKLVKLVSSTIDAVGKMKLSQ
jgi:hypothetical protein